VPGDCAPWLDHLRWLLPVDSHREYLLDWMAYTAQHPTKKINHQLLIGGTPRIGKDAAIRPLISAIGDWNAKEVMPNEIKGGFNEWLSCTKLVVVQEIADFENSAIENKLKPICAAPPAHLTLNRKGMIQYQVPNVLAMVIMTNERQPMPIRRNNERFFCLWCPQDKQTDEYYKRLYDWLKSNTHHTAHYLLTRDVTRFNPGALPLSTPWREEIAGFSDDNLTMVLRAAIEEGDGVFEADLVAIEDVARMTKAKQKPVGARMQEMGCIRRKVSYRLPGGKVGKKSIWAVRNHLKYSEQNMTGQALWDTFRAQREAANRWQYVPSESF
jgi:hypothetical protein